jgi:hypothetical protein
MMSRQEQIQEMLALAGQERRALSRLLAESEASLGWSAEALEARCGWNAERQTELLRAGLLWAVEGAYLPSEYLRQCCLPELSEPMGLAELGHRLSEALDDWQEGLPALLPGLRARIARVLAQLRWQLEQEALLAWQQIERADQAGEPLRGRLLRRLLDALGAEEGPADALESLLSGHPALRYEEDLGWQRFVLGCRELLRQMRESRPQRAATLGGLLAGEDPSAGRLAALRRWLAAAALGKAPALPQEPSPALLWESPAPRALRLPPGSLSEERLGSLLRKQRLPSLPQPAQAPAEAGEWQATVLDPDALFQQFRASGLDLFRWLQARSGQASAARVAPLFFQLLRLFAGRLAFTGETFDEGGYCVGIVLPAPQETS